MLACAAIQKLERYGLLGIKRHSPEDFVISSLKDERRTSVYALTHEATWEECRDALDASSPATATALPWSPARGAHFTEALLYAMSFSTSFVCHHLHDIAQRPQSCQLAAAPEGRVFTDDFASALRLLRLLKEVAIAVGGGAALHRSATSVAFTKAAGHLLAAAVDTALILLSMRMEWRLSKAGMKSPDAAKDLQVVEDLVAQTMVLLTSVSQTFDRAEKKHGVPNFFHARTCSALLKQLSQKSLQMSSARSTEAGHPRTPGRSALSALHPLLGLLCEHVRVSGAIVKSGVAVFKLFSLYQRIALLHGVIDATAADLLHGKAEMSSTDQSLQVAFDGAKKWLCRLLCSTACNRATRYVIYFREDELKLMQHHIRQASDYALHTYSTTPPLERELLELLLSTSSGKTPVAAFSTAALAIAQWIVSLPTFFESFCTDGSWAAFAQEQRRNVLLQQSLARRGMEKVRRSSSSRSRDHRESSRQSTSSRSSVSLSSDADDRESVTSAQSFQSVAVDGMGSTTSLASRASLLSTLSKRSTASYLSFISVLRHANGGRGEGNTADGEAGAEEGRIHESEDGNTNLPLILLEQLVLALHRFMEAYSPQLLDSYGLRSLCWQSIAKMLFFVQASMHQSSSCTAAAVDGAMPASAGRPTGRLTLHDAHQPLFHLGNDIRFNDGLGYESLGLLFAKVVAPLLEEGDEAVASSSGGGRAGLAEEDSLATRASVEASLASCLHAYEIIAPQVVDMNLRVVLRIAARAMASSSASSSTVLRGFLVEVTRRLGRTNQLPLLLDALLNKQTSLEDGDTAMQMDTAVALSDVVALRAAFASPLVRQAVGDAAGMSLDPESLLQYVTGIVTTWGNAEDVKESAEDGESRDRRQQILFALELVEATIEGIRPTSVSAGSVLENTTELELLMTAFALPMLTEATVRCSADHRRVGVQAVRVIFQCRSITRICLQDLGSQQVYDYIAMLDDTLWQTESEAGALIGSIGLDGIRRALLAPHRCHGLPPDSPVSSPLLLLPELVLQRLSLVQTVQTALGRVAGPRDELKYLVMYLLNFLSGTEDEAPPASVIAFANRLTQAEWVSIASLAKPRHMRAAMARLLRIGMAASPDIPRAAPFLEAMPFHWLRQCLVCIGSTTLRTVNDAFIATTPDELEGAAAGHAGNHAGRSGGEVVAPLHGITSLAAILREAYAVVEHNPYWPSVLRSTTRFLLRLGSSAVSDRAEELRARLLLLALLILRSEARSAEALKKMLAATGAISTSAGARSGIAILFQHSLAVPALLSSDVAAVPSAVGEEGEEKNSPVPSIDCFNEELQDLCGDLFTKRFIKVLIAISTDAVATPSSHDSTARHASMAILAFLYDTSLGAAQQAWRTKTVQGDSVEALRASPAVQFLYIVAQRFRCGRLSCTEQTVSAASAAMAMDRALVSFLRSLTTPSGLTVHIASSSSSLPSERRRPRLGGSDAPRLGALDHVEAQWRALLSFHLQCIFRSDDTAASIDGDISFNACAAHQLLEALWRSHERRPSGSSSGWKRSSEERQSPRSDVAATPMQNFLLSILHSDRRDADDGKDDGTCVVAGNADGAADSAGATNSRQELTTLEKSLYGFFTVLCEDRTPSRLAQRSSPTLQRSVARLTRLLSCTAGSSGVVVLWMAVEMVTVAVKSSSSSMAEATSSSTASGLPSHNQRSSPEAGWSSVLLEGVYQHFVTLLYYYPIALHRILVDAGMQNAESLDAKMIAGVTSYIVTAMQVQHQTSVVASVDSHTEDRPRTVAMVQSPRPEELFSWLQSNATNDEAEVSPWATAGVTRYYARLMGAAPDILRLLPVSGAARHGRHGGAALLLLSYLHFFLTATLVPYSVPRGALSAHDEDDGNAAQQRWYDLLCGAAQMLCRVAPLLRAARHFESIVQPHWQSLMQLSTSHSSAALVLRRVSTAATTPSLWMGCMQLCDVAARMHVISEHRGGALTDKAWLFLLSLLETTNITTVASPPTSSAVKTAISSPTVATEVATAAAAPPSSRTALTEAEVVYLIQLLTGTMLRSGAIWSSPAVVPTIFSALLSCILAGVEQRLYTVKTLHLLAAGYYVLARHVNSQSAMAEDEAAVDDTEEAVEKKAAREADASSCGAPADGRTTAKTTASAAPRRQGHAGVDASGAWLHRTSSSVKLICVAAITATLFETARHHLHVFTTYSSAMDLLAADFLRTLSEHLLPAVKAPPIAYRPGVEIKGSGLSEMTYADLAYMAVGSEESRSLLKQAALRIEEADESRSGRLLTDGGRSLFRVSE